MIDPSALMTVASIVAGFGVAVIMFRLQRELNISDKNWERKSKDSGAELIPTWIPLADMLVVVAVLVALLLVVVPLLITQSEDVLTTSAAWCAVAMVLLAGYVPAIVAHYRFIFWLHESRPHFTIIEAVIVVGTVIAAALVFDSVISA